MGDNGGKKVKGLVKRTCMNDPWTWTMAWELIVGVWGGMGGGWQRGKNWDDCNRIRILK